MRKSFGQTLLQSNANQRRTLASLVRILGLQNKGTISKVCASFIRRRATANPMRIKSVEFNAIWVLGQRAIQPIADNAPPKSAQKCVVRCGFVASFPSPPTPYHSSLPGTKIDSRTQYKTVFISIHLSFSGCRFISINLCNYLLF